MPECDFKKVASHECSPVNLLHFFRTTFLKKTSGGLLLYFSKQVCATVFEHSSTLS